MLMPPQYYLSDETYAMLPPCRTPTETRHKKYRLCAVPDWEASIGTKRGAAIDLCRRQAVMRAQDAVSQCRGAADPNS